MIAGFFGHAGLVDADKIKSLLRARMETVIGHREAELWLGAHGAFDAISFCVARDFKRVHPLARMVLVTPYLDAKEVREAREAYDAVLYPPIETVPKRLAILARNRYVARNADVIFAYVDHSFGGAAQALIEAERAKKQIFNLAER